MAVTRESGNRTRRSSRPIRLAVRPRIRLATYALGMYGDFRERVVEAAERVLERTGIDPLDADASRAVTTDARLEQLPLSIGWGLGAMGLAAAIASVGFILNPATGPGIPLTGAFVVVALLLLLGCVACVVVSRAARSRRPRHDLFDDAWARLAVEIWPAPRYQSWNGTVSSGASYSRSEFLYALRDGRPLDDFTRRAPLTRMP